MVSNYSCISLVLKKIMTFDHEYSSGVVVKVSPNIITRDLFYPYKK